MVRASDPIEQRSMPHRCGEPARRVRRGPTGPGQLLPAYGHRGEQLTMPEHIVDKDFTRRSRFSHGFRHPLGTDEFDLKGD